MREEADENILHSSKSEGIDEDVIGIVANLSG